MSDDQIQSISECTGIAPEDVRRYRQIDQFDAIDKYLSQPAKQRLFNEGYKKPKTDEEKANMAWLLIARIHPYKEDFCRTEEGRLWYLCNVPDLTRIGIEARAAAQRYTLAREESLSRVRKPLDEMVFVG